MGRDRAIETLMDRESRGSFYRAARVVVRGTNKRDISSVSAAFSVALTALRRILGRCGGCDTEKKDQD